ncbi:hypothetical protein MACH26_23740 [Planctobacterium marinum]|uniref:Uncharacterized protein n=2 Tax=Planctobacterium marinum TaxID=1631968 RepID=A0AA48HVZ0_9ALTE|nr:hypothetical protein MACH26_23740 [Planctobacterium marinum]
MRAINELKIKAKKKLKSEQSATEGLTLTDCQQSLAQKAGFSHWHHALEVLSGEPRNSDCGKLWHHPSCDVLLNLWFANYEEAHAALTKNLDKFLLPYKTQFVLVTEEYLTLIGLTPQLQTELRNHGADLTRLGNTRLWDDIALRCIRHKL